MLQALYSQAGYNWGYRRLMRATGCLFFTIIQSEKMPEFEDVAYSVGPNTVSSFGVMCFPR
jgi:hypothetical protein